MILGEPEGDISDRALRNAAALEAGGMGAQVVPDIRTKVWEKLWGDMATGPLAILTGKGLSDMKGDPVQWRAGIAAMKECPSKECLSIAPAHGRRVMFDVAARSDS